MDPAHRRHMTEDEYLEMERHSEVKHEYVNGEIIAMAGASFRHNLITANVGRELGVRLGDRCFVVQSDQRVHTRTTSLYAYPDVSVVCGPPEFHPKDRMVIVNPTLIVEVLSDSTELWDRSVKAAHYRQLLSLQTYIFVAQSERHVEIYQRSSDGKWTFSEYRDGDVAPLAALAVELPLDAVYRGVDRLPAEPE